MFALLIGVGALFLAVFVSAILDPRWCGTGGADEHARAESGHVVDDILRQQIARRWRPGFLIARRRASAFSVTSPFARQLAQLAVWPSPAVA